MYNTKLMYFREWVTKRGIRVDSIARGMRKAVGLYWGLYSGKTGRAEKKLLEEIKDYFHHRNGIDDVVLGWYKTKDFDGTTFSSREKHIIRDFEYMIPRGLDLDGIISKRRHDRIMDKVYAERERIKEIESKRMAKRK